jgi:hypothetical protein
MKASHFDVGKMGGTMVNPKPLDPIPAPARNETTFDINEARQRLGEAHWDHGQSKIKFESIN